MIDENNPTNGSVANFDVTVCIEEAEASLPTAGDEHGSQLMQSLKSFYVQGRHCDVILRVCDDVSPFTCSEMTLMMERNDSGAGNDSSSTTREFPCHRLVLSANSSLFDELFTLSSHSSYNAPSHNCIEQQPFWDSHGVQIVNSNNNNLYNVELKNIDSNCVATILDFVYSGHVDIKPNVAQTVLKHAERLKFHSLANFCKDLMFGQQLNVSNCIPVLISASNMQMDELTECAFKVLLANFQEAVAECEQLFVEKCPVDVLRKLLASDHLQVQNETEVYRVLMKWVEQDVQSRGAAGADSCFPRLFNLLRIACMPNEFLLDVVMDNDLVLSHKSCISLTRSAIRFHLGYQGAMTGDRRSSGLGSTTNSLLDSKEESGGSIKKNNLETYHKTARYSTHTLVGLTNKGDIQTYSTFARKWQIVQEKQMYDGFSAVVIDNKLFVFDVDKSSSESYRAKLEMYDPVCGTWESLTPMPTTRVWFALCVVGYKDVYTFGGYTSDGMYLNTAEMLPYNFDTKRFEAWQWSQPMRIKRSGSAAAVIGQKIYIAGGWCNRSLATVEVFDVREKQWSKCASLTFARHGARMATTASQTAHANNLFIFGGVGTHDHLLDSCEKYNALDDTWTRIASMHIARFSFGLAFLSGKFLIVGGSGGGFTIEIYDPCKDEWLQDSIDKVNPIQKCTQQLVILNRPIPCSLERT